MTRRKTRKNSKQNKTLKQPAPPLEALQTMEAFERRRAHEAEMGVTMIGRQSMALREQANQLSREGRSGDAHTLYQQAVGLFSLTDRSAAAAACWYDLAESNYRLQSGVKRENLLQAEAYYRGALESPSRMADPHRAALTRDGLGRCLRRLAHDPDCKEQQREAWLDEAEQQMGEACALALSMGSFGLENTAGYHHNLANLLHQRGKLTESIGAYGRCKALLVKAQQVRMPDMDHNQPIKIYCQALFYESLVRLERCKKGDVLRAKKLLEEVIRLDEPDYKQLAWIELARQLLKEGANSKAAAEELLSLVQIESVPDENINVLVNAYQAAGMSRQAKATLYKAIDGAIKTRRATVADHVADHAAHRAQQLALSLARLHARDDEPVEAFLSLERVSGLRYMEAVGRFTWTPADPVTRSLKMHREAAGSVAAWAEWLCGFVVHLPLAEQRKVLDEMISGAAKMPDMVLGSEASWGEVIKQAQQAFQESLLEIHQGDHLVEDLRVLSQAYGRRAIALEGMVIERHPEEMQQHWAEGASLEQEDLKKILAENPGTVLIRLHLDVELFAVSVWLEGGQLVGRSCLLDLQEQVIQLLDAFQPTREDYQAEQIGELLSGLDLSPVFPDESKSQVIFLPSLLASYLPMCALGPDGATALDHFEAVCWLPSLMPLSTRQGAQSPRDGVLTVSPAEAGARGGTQFHEQALRTSLPKETRLTGAAATTEAVIAQARGVDVVSIYSHGRHKGENDLPEVWLADGPLDLSHMGVAWQGLERVEVWACESGVSQSHDWLTPFVDEAFGLDAELGKEGVRSTIGTLWTVPDYLTACIVNRYRQGLLQGAAPPKALADAQRWWRDEAVDRLEEKMLAGADVEALGAFAYELGLPDPGQDFVDALSRELGEVTDSEPVPKADVDTVIRKFRSPRTWAGYRFMGVAERRPTEPWTDEHQREPNEQERAEIDRLLSSAEKRAGAQKSAAEESEGGLISQEKEMFGDVKNGIAESALLRAEYYQRRLIGSSTHNLLRGLSWLHEALAQDSLNSTDRQRLALEAAWLWIDLARGEAIRPPQLLTGAPPPVAVSRAVALFEEAQAGPSKDIGKIWANFLRICPGGPDALKKQEASLQGQIVATFTKTPREDIHLVRATTEALELLALLLAPQRQAVSVVLKQAMWVRDKPLEEPGVVSLFARMDSAARAAAGRVDLSAPVAFQPDALYRNRELLRDISAIWLDPTAMAPRSHHRSKGIIDESLAQVESTYWGYPTDDGEQFWASTGTPGSAYRLVAGGYLSSRAMHPGKGQLAAHLIAGLQIGCDLRLTRLNRWASLVSHADFNRTPFRLLWHNVFAREKVLELLEDAALLPDLDSSERVKSEFLARPHSSDPFVLSSRQIMSRNENSTCATGYGLGSCCTEWFESSEVQESATASGAAAVELDRLDRNIEEMWVVVAGGLEKMDEIREARKVTAMVREPHLSIERNEQLLRSIPPGNIVIGLGTGGAGELLGAAVWNQGSGIKQHLAQSKPGGAWDLTHQIGALTSPLKPDLGEHRGLSGQRPELWALVNKTLGGLLGQLLTPALQGEPCLLTVLAPGALRPLPWFGLTVGGAPLFDQVLGLRHLPSLGFEQTHALRAQPFEEATQVCLLAPNRGAGDTSFGEAAVGTLRNWSPGTLIVDPETMPVDRHIVEAGTIEAQSSKLNGLRLYGVGWNEALNEGTAGLTLTGERVLHQANMRGFLFGKSPCVELWAATSMGTIGISPRNDRDRIPGLAWAFLAGGAAGVIDLAWPVHDLVKALVCEQFGIARLSGTTNGGLALAWALSQVATMLADWRPAALKSGSVAEALALLDRARRDAAGKATLDAKAVLPLALRDDSLKGEHASVAGLVQEVCQPVHLASFRYWGA